MKKLLPIFLLVGCLLVAVARVHAAVLRVEKIGSDNVAGKTFASWTHYGLNPMLIGTATPSASVIVSINGTSTATAASEDGTWTLPPKLSGAGSMSQYGVYEISISSGIENILFSLTLASASGSNTNDSTTKGGVSTQSSATSLPQSGFSDLFVFTGVGVLFLASAVASRYVFVQIDKDRE